MAVFVFFVLSGFVITEAARQFYVGRPVAYMVNRLLRLYPQYLLCLLMTIVVVALPPFGQPLPQTAMQVPNLFENAFSIFPFAGIFDHFFTNGRRTDFISIVWAVRVEFTFYACVFFILSAATFAQQMTTLSIWWACVLALTANAVLTILLDLHAASYYAAFIPLFVVGICLSLLFGKQKTHMVHIWYGLGSVALLLGAMQALIYPKYMVNLPTVVESWDSFQWLGPAVFFILVGLLAVLLFLPIPERFIRLDQAAGELSYLVYLCHLCAVYFAQKYLPYSILNIFFVPIAGVFLAMSLATISERPLLRLRERVRRTGLP